MGTEIKVGDVVKLKSGGPEMTVQGDAYGMTLCTWFDGQKQQTGRFSQDTLRIVDKPSSD